MRRGTGAGIDGADGGAAALLYDFPLDRPGGASRSFKSLVPTMVMTRAAPKKSNAAAAKIRSQTYAHVIIVAPEDVISASGVIR